MSEVGARGEASPERDDGRLALDPTEAHLHVVSLDAYAHVTEEALLARYGAWMSADEEAKRRRFLREDKRREHVMTRALVRGTLSRYAHVDPRAWRFEENAHGKPRIAPGLLPGLDLRFNLSNTVGCVVLLAAAGREVGVDVELGARELDVHALAVTHFAPSEVVALDRLAPSARRERFLDVWTLKEAYIKARGVGLALPLDGFAFDLDRPGGSIGFEAKADVDPEPTRWQFQRHDVSAAHRVASAIEVKHGEKVTVRVFDGAIALRPREAPGT